jgi:glycosyltransferase involved in cell wall biosynthesis
MVSFDWDHKYLNSLLLLINPDIIIDHYSIYTINNEDIYKYINKNIILTFVHSATCYNNDISQLKICNSIHLYKEDNKHISWHNIFKNYYVTLGTELNDIIDTELNNNESELTNIIDKELHNNETKLNDNELEFNDNETEINNIINLKLNNNESELNDIIKCKENKQIKQITQIKKNKINIGIIGRIAEEKLPLLFLEKLCKLSVDSYNNIEINIYGEKDRIFNKLYVEKFENIIKKSKIIVNPFFNPLEMYKIYTKIDILLIPSVYETGSFTCIEAFSFGIPVIARNVYGLKYMIENGKTGYLCNNDEEIIDKLNHINVDILFNNKNLIIEESYKYNIINKIKDLEIIIDNNLSERNLVIITSVINCSKNRLSYYHTRSMFNIEERYKQTIKTIESINKYIPNCDILFCEASNLLLNKDIENDIKSKVKYYYNFYYDNNQNIENAVNSEMKGLGEANILLKAIEKIIEEHMNYKYIFKISGRYYLNSSFNYNFNNDKNIVRLWDNCDSAFCTIFYKINMNDIYFYSDFLNNSLEDLKNGKSIEICLYKYFNKNIKILDKMNVSGFLATEGYLFTV